MITEAKFKLALKDMMRTKRLEDINVTALCKKCNVHRQTFYYHYQDIYDLIAAIFLNEDLSAADRAKDVSGVLSVFTEYVYENFAFLRSTYNSAARDLTDDFIFGKLHASLFLLWGEDNDLPLTEGMSKEELRNSSRIFSHIISDEFGHCFKDADLTPAAFRARMNGFCKNAVEIMLPAVLALAKKEGKSLK